MIWKESRKREGEVEKLECTVVGKGEERKGSERKEAEIRNKRE